MQGLTGSTVQLRGDLVQGCLRIAVHRRANSEVFSLRNYEDPFCLTDPSNAIDFHPFCRIFRIDRWTVPSVRILNVGTQQTWSTLWESPSQARRRPNPQEFADLIGLSSAPQPDRRQQVESVRSDQAGSPRYLSWPVCCVTGDGYAAEDTTNGPVRNHGTSPR